MKSPLYYFHAFIFYLVYNSIKTAKIKLTNSIKAWNNMKYLFTPTVFHSVAQLMSGYRWRLLIWSALGLTLYFLLTTQINFNTPNALIWLTMFIVFAALQALVLSAFIFSFKIYLQKKRKKPFGINYIT